jgi:sirohydrochlorin ferrochelatase
MTASASSWGVLILHPSRRPVAKEAMRRLQARLREERPGYVIWTLQTPVAPVLDHARQAPPGESLTLVPLLLTPGAHYQEDVAELAAAVQAAVPGLEVRVLPTLLQDESFLQWLLDRL